MKQKGQWAMMREVKDGGENKSGERERERESEIGN